MAKRGGFPGGGMPGNMANLMKQAQKMQKQMEEQAKEMEEKSFTATAGGGAVEVTVSGKKEVLIMAAVNEALRQVDEANTSAMSKLTGGLGGMPGMF